MFSKRPIQRAITIVLELSKDEFLRGEVYGNDYGDGATTHQINGRLTGGDGVVHVVNGHLEGVRFVAIERRGRPKNQARDVALHFAFLWFIKAGSSTSQAREKVLSLWSDNDWKGCSENSHLSRLKKNGAKAVHGLSVFSFVGETANTGVVIAMPPSAFKEATPNQRVEASGTGWIWGLGKECAEYGSIEFSVPLVHEIATGEAGGFGFVENPVAVNFQRNK